MSEYPAGWSQAAKATAGLGTPSKGLGGSVGLGVQLRTGGMGQSAFGRPTDTTRDVRHRQVADKSALLRRTAPQAAPAILCPRRWRCVDLPSLKSRRAELRPLLSPRLGARPPSKLAAVCSRPIFMRNLPKLHDCPTFIAARSAVWTISP